MEFHEYKFLSDGKLVLKWDKPVQWWLYKCSTTYSLNWDWVFVIRLNERSYHSRILEFLAIFTKYLNILKTKAWAVSMTTCKISSGEWRGHVHGYNMILPSKKWGSCHLEIAVFRVFGKNQPQWLHYSSLQFKTTTYN